MPAADIKGHVSKGGHVTSPQDIRSARNSKTPLLHLQPEDRRNCRIDHYLPGKMKILSLQTLLQDSELLAADRAAQDASNLAIYCMDLNKNDNLLAVGTIDGCIKIYDMNINKLVTSLDSHNGTVTCMKWTSCGKFLVSGSDDKCIIIWQKQQLSTSKQKMVHFQLVKRLIGHESDVQNLSFNSGDNLLMSCGLDCKIIIWQFNHTTLLTSKLLELDNIHTNFIKGCEFDPTGKFFATISDDKILKIYKYSFNKINNAFKFNLEVEITEPFKDSKSFKVTYFSKMHWSPNGQFLIIPNGKSGILENCCILVDRLNHWDYSFKLIGNAMPIEVCRFNPVVFVNDNNSKGISDPVNSISEQNLIIATGGQEKCLVLWSTTKCVPLIVLKNMFKKQISDLTWDKNGCRLYISSFDGDIKVLDFEDVKELTEFINLTKDSEEEFKLKAVDPEQNYKFLQKYGNSKQEKSLGEDNKLLETIEDIEIGKMVNDLLPEKYQSTKGDEVNTSNKNDEQNRSNNIEKSSNKDVEPSINILVAKRRSNSRNSDGTIKKRRVVLQPVLKAAASTETEASKPKDTAGKKTDSNVANEQITFDVKNLSKSSVKLPRLGYQTLIQGLKENQEWHRKHLFAKNDSLEALSSRIGLSASTISSVLPDTDLHTEVSMNTGHVFEIRNSKERKLIYDEHVGRNESYGNLTKMLCFKKGSIKWDFFCKENITQFLLVNDKTICICLDDHQLLILSIDTGLTITNKIYFNDRILQVKLLADHKDLLSTEPSSLLIMGENGSLTLMTEDTVLFKEISTSHLLYSDICLSDHLRVKKVHCGKKFYDTYLNKDRNLVVDLLVFEKLYQYEYNKYITKGSGNNKPRYFNFDESLIFKELRKQKYSFPKKESALLIKESYSYSPAMQCWLLSD